MKEEVKIQNIPSYSKLRNDIEGVDSLRKFVKFLSVFGIKVKELNETLDKIPDLKKQIIHLSELPDRFNKHFAQSGWIAYESMNSELMERTVQLADSEEITKANLELINYYCSTVIERLLVTFKGIPEFAKRYDFIELAYQDTIDKKYYSCIPTLLMDIDGSVNDIDRNKGFFTESTDLTAWDSVAAHSSGLSVIRDIFNSARKKTTTETIDMPYRNGILHGRDLGFANIVVAAKCWATLFAIKDWASAVKDGKKVAPEPEKELGFRENLVELKKSLDNYIETKKRSAKVSMMVEKWKPRKVIIGVDIPEYGDAKEYKDFYPEKEAILFATYWQKRNYGKIVGQIHRYSSNEVSLGKEAKRIRELLDDKKLIDYKLSKIEDKSPTISEITLDVVYDYNQERISKSITLRFICEGNVGEISIIGDENCSWRFLDNFFYEIDLVN